MGSNRTAQSAAGCRPPPAIMGSAHAPGSPQSPPSGESTVVSAACAAEHVAGHRAEAHSHFAPVKDKSGSAMDILSRIGRRTLHTLTYTSTSIYCWPCAWFLLVESFAFSRCFGCCPAFTCGLYSYNDISLHSAWSIPPVH